MEPGRVDRRDAEVEQHTLDLHEDVVHEPVHEEQRVPRAGDERVKSVCASVCTRTFPSLCVQ